MTQTFIRLKSSVKVDRDGKLKEFIENLEIEQKFFLKEIGVL